MTYIFNFYSQHARADYNAQTGNYIPEWQKLARTTHKHVKLSETNIPLTNYGSYSPAYVTTNEDWRFIGNALCPRNKSILTVAGSGDQPIAFALCGAKIVDTFDISYFAHIITNLKIAAIQTLDYEEYTNFVASLRTATCPDEIAHYDKIAPKCSNKTRNTVYQMNGCLIFKQGIGMYQEYMPNKFEYAMAKKLITQPMDFIWSNVDSLHGFLTRQYDLIYMSSVFDFYRDETKITNTINSLRPNLTDNGCIALYLSDGMPATKRAQLVSAAKNSELNQIHFHKSDNDKEIMTLSAPIRQMINQRIQMQSR